MAIEGLNMKDHEVDKHFTNNPHDITEAAHGVLQEWCKGQQNLSEARTALNQTLHTLGLPALEEHLK